MAPTNQCKRLILRLFCQELTLPQFQHHHNHNHCWMPLRCGADIRICLVRGGLDLPLVSPPAQYGAYYGCGWHLRLYLWHKSSMVAPAFLNDQYASGCWTHGIADQQACLCHKVGLPAHCPLLCWRVHVRMMIMVALKPVDLSSGSLVSLLVDPRFRPCQSSIPFSTVIQVGTSE